jgi:hypothetical protein
LVDLGLVEIRNDAPVLTNAGHQVLDWGVDGGRHAAGWSCFSAPHAMILSGSSVTVSFAPSHGARMTRAHVGINGIAFEAFRRQASASPFINIKFHGSASA